MSLKCSSIVWPFIFLARLYAYYILFLEVKQLLPFQTSTAPYYLIAYVCINLLLYPKHFHDDFSRSSQMRFI
ncbi:hypothetical protein EDC96DRAFT_491448 [Choanephora cucurbitarum]|nr:hypothetical protein EDC96DRAFT_491448 [Choanephora cucurbitarum]